MRPDELGRLARTFDALLDRVAASVRHEQRLSAELSHELRTPLSRIVAEVELLQRRERAPEERREALAAIARSAGEMSGVLETLMAAARAEAGLDSGRADLREVLGRLRTTWEPVLAERDLTLDVRVPSERLIAGVAPELVERAVTPLLDNARRHARARVRLEALASGSDVAIAVADDGPGLPAGEGDRIFEPGVSVATNGHRGAGLGLPLARRLARAAGGDVVPREGGGPGAELRVVLPALHGTERPTGPAAR
jgi:signal transduction histidine kinase